MPEVQSTSGSQKWDAEQTRNAALIIRVGQQMGMSRKDIAIGLIVAMQESSLRNLHSGDRDSQGLFQQRPSQGWGTADMKERTGDAERVRTLLAQSNVTDVTDVETRYEVLSLDVHKGWNWNRGEDKGNSFACTMCWRRSG